MNLPDTLHCANISIISDASCRKDYPGHLMNTMVCAGVEGGGTDSCEVRTQRGPTARGEEGGPRLGVGPRSDVAWLGPEKRGGVRLGMEKEGQLEGGWGLELETW